MRLRLLLALPLACAWSAEALHGAVARSEGASRRRHGAPSAAATASPLLNLRIGRACAALQTPSIQP